MTSDARERRPADVNPSIHSRGILLLGVYIKVKAATDVVWRHYVDMENFEHNFRGAVSQMSGSRGGGRPLWSISSVFNSGDADDVQGQIGLKLRAVYETVVAEPVPDHFMSLLESLDCSTARRV